MLFIVYILSPLSFFTQKTKTKSSGDCNIFLRFQNQSAAYMNWLETVCLNKYTRFFCFFFFFPSKNNDYNLQTFSLSLYQYTIYIIWRSPISVVVQISQMAALKGSLRRRDGAVAHFLPRYWGFGHRHHFFRVRNLSSVRIHLWNLRFNMTAKVRVSYPFVFKFYSAPLLFIFLA